MQRAFVVLSQLSQKSLKNNGFIFHRVYRNFFNEDFYEMIIKKEKNSMISKDNLQKMIEDLKHERLDRLMNSPAEKVIIFHLASALLKSIYEPLVMGKSRENFFYKTRAKGLQFKMDILKKDYKKYNWYLKMRLEFDYQELECREILSLFSSKIHDNRFIRLLGEFIEWAKKNPYHQESTELKRIIMVAQYRTVLSLLEMENQDYCIHEGECLLPLQNTKDLMIAKKDLAGSYLKKFNGVLIENKIELLNLSDTDLEFANFIIKKQNKGKIILLTPKHWIDQSIKPFLKKNKPVHYNKRIHLPVQKIYQEFKKDKKKLDEIFYKTENYGIRMKKFEYYHHLSLLKTIARKEKTSVKKVRQKYHDLLRD